MKKNKKVIIISGFGGSGKSTCVEAIAKAFKMKTVFTSGVLKRLLLEETGAFEKFEKNEGIWESEKGKKLWEKRKNPKFDKKLDKELIKIIEQGNVVMDSWTMGYLSKKGFKIWLTAPIQERAKRAASRNSQSIEETTIAIQEKDKKTTQIYENLYGFTLGKNLEQFDLILNTSNFSKKQMQKIIVQIVKAFFENQ